MSEFDTIHRDDYFRPENSDSTMSIKADSITILSEIWLKVDYIALAYKFQVKCRIFTNYIFYLNTWPQTLSVSVIYSSSY